MTDFIDPILTASTLQQLCDAMNEAGDEINHLQSGGDDATALIHAYEQAVSNCPTFSPDVPADTAGIWSWDADGLLVGEGWGQCEIVARSEW